MPTNLLSLVAKRDFTMVASGGSVVHRLLKPMSFELKTAQALIIRTRQNSMRELFERESEQEREDFKRLNMVVKSTICRYRCPPLGMLMARQ